MLANHLFTSYESDPLVTLGLPCLPLGYIHEEKFPVDRWLSSLHFITKKSCVQCQSPASFSSFVLDSDSTLRRSGELSRASTVCTIHKARQKKSRWVSETAKAVSGDNLFFSLGMFPSFSMLNVRSVTHSLTRSHRNPLPLVLLVITTVF